jgi:FKBP-type peptidyl-prolyl cis-trans isomerase FkpA
MSSATAVPLRPVKKSGLAVLWIGLALLVAASAAWAFWSRPPSIRLETVQAGHGRHPTDSDFAIINYRGRLAATGSEFDAGQQTPLPVGRMVPGFSQGLKRMQAGGKYILHIPASLGYGAQETGPIPANSDLVFEVELLDIKTAQEMQQMMMMQQMIQQQMQQQQGGGQPQ